MIGGVEHKARVKIAGNGQPAAWLSPLEIKIIDRFQLATRFLRDQILAHLDGGLDRIDRLPTLVEDVPPDQRALVRAHIGMLQSWQKKTRRVLPIVLKIPGG